MKIAEMYSTKDETNVDPNCGPGEFIHNEAEGKVVIEGGDTDV